MSRYVKISTLGPPPFSTGISKDYKSVINEMKKHWTKQIDQVIYERPDLIILPEFCDMPEDLSAKGKLEYYRERKDQILDFFRIKARENGCNIAYSAVSEMEDGTFRDLTQIIDRNGNIQGIYSKNHPTIREIDDGEILSGKNASVIECDFGRVACIICFDLNFDELRSRYKKLKPELIIFSSMYHGGLMSKYWAYYCRSYFAGAIAGLQNYIISPVGDMIAASTNYFEYLTHTINLDYKVIWIGMNREKIKNMKRKYGPKIKITDPGYLGSVLVTSESDDISINDVLDEFQIEDVDQYFERSLEYQEYNMER